MKLASVTIKKFRGIEELIDFQLKDFSIIVGDNGTSKTTILEAINFCLTPSFLSGRIKHTDFFNGGDEPIEIMLTFNDVFSAELADGYQSFIVDCNRIYVKIKKRDKPASGKSFCDIVVVEHYVVPKLPRTNPKGWELKRVSGSLFKFNERQLTFPIPTRGLLKSFYFNKSRDKQIQKGFNSSINSVYDDLNWRFAKQIRKVSNTFFSDKSKLEDDILAKVDNKIIEKTFDELNDKLKKLDIDEVSLSFFDSHAPFDSAFLNYKVGDLEIPVSNLGSGIEMMVSLMFLETLAALSKENILIIIDEPELHLHPKLQTSLINYLKSIAGNIQIIINSHSPYIFKNCLNHPSIELIVTNKTTSGLTITNIGLSKGLFPWSPSWGEINYKAYDLLTIEFHNELYGYIQEKNLVYSEKKFEDFVAAKNIPLNKRWTKVSKSVPIAPYDVSIMTYIRNKIHHPENPCNPDYTERELRTSIEEMIRLI